MKKTREHMLQDENKKTLITFSSAIESEDIPKDSMEQLVFPKNRLSQIVFWRLRIFVMTFLWAIGKVIESIFVFFFGTCLVVITFGFYTTLCEQGIVGLAQNILRVFSAILRLMIPPFHRTPRQIAKILAFDIMGEEDHAKPHYTMPDISRVYQVLAPNAHKRNSCKSIKKLEEAWKEAFYEVRKIILEEISKDTHLPLIDPAEIKFGINSTEIIQLNDDICKIRIYLKTFTLPHPSREPVSIGIPFSVCFVQPAVKLGVDWWLLLGIPGEIRLEEIIGPLKNKSVQQKSEVEKESEINNRQAFFGGIILISIGVICVIASINTREAIRGPIELYFIMCGIWICFGIYFIAGAIWAWIRGFLGYLSEKLSKKDY